MMIALKKDKAGEHAVRGKDLNQHLSQRCAIPYLPPTPSHGQSVGFCNRSVHSRQAYKSDAMPTDK